MFTWDGKINKNIYVQKLMKLENMSEEKAISIWSDIMKKCFKWTHEADDKARLIYNDYGITFYNQKIKGIIKWIKQAKKEGVPIHEIGIQCHEVLQDSWFNQDNTLKDEIKKNIISNINNILINRLTVNISELDVCIFALTDKTLESKLEKQTEFYKFIYSLQKKLRAITVWDFTDKNSWIYKFYKKSKNYDFIMYDKNKEQDIKMLESPCLYDQFLEPKECYLEIKDIFDKDK
jgi:GH35 family endo-1,4-beta-xylanase